MIDFIKQEIDLEPCPYCKFKYIALITESQEIKYYRFVSYAYAYCGECFARGPAFHELDGDDYKEKAEAAWNEVARLKGVAITQDRGEK